MPLPATMNMLEHLFGSKTRVRLLRLFLNDGNEKYFVRELTRRIGAQINAVRNELSHLVKFGLVSVVEVVDEDAKTSRSRLPRKKFYKLNTDAILYPELKALFGKSSLLLEKDLIRKLTHAGQLQYLALTGSFVGLEDAPTDLLVVGRISRDKLVPIIKEFEQEVGREVNYTMMTTQEFKERRDMTDRFLFSILESRKLVVLDNVTTQDISQLS